MTKTNKTILSAILCFAMVLCLTLGVMLAMPVTALAESLTDAHTHGEGDDAITFTAWKDATKLPDTEGNYYLDTDVTLSSQAWNVPSGTTNLCLSGHVIKQVTAGKRVVNIQKGCTLNIYDCDNTEHYGHLDSKLWVPDTTKTSDNISIFGGYITGGNVPLNQASVDGIAGGISFWPATGGAVYVFGGGTLNFYGGNIVGNQATVGGSAVYIDATASFTMYGGSIVGNKQECTLDATQGGGAILSAGTTRLLGGRIAYNQAEFGGGVSMQYAAGTVELDGAEISVHGAHILRKVRDTLQT